MKQREAKTRCAEISLWYNFISVVKARLYQVRAIIDPHRTYDAYLLYSNVLTLNLFFQLMPCLQCASSDRQFGV